MKQRLILLLTAVLLLSSCSTPQSIHQGKPVLAAGERGRDQLVGKWLGEAPMKNGGEKQWLNHRSPDGMYVITFKTSVAGYVEVSHEYVFWGYSGGIYFTKMLGWIENGWKEPVRNPSSYYDDAYRVVELSAEIFRYESFATREVYSVRRVSDDFLLH